MKRIYVNKQKIQLFDCTLISLLFCYLSMAGAKPTLTFNFHQSLQNIPSFSALTQQIIDRRTEQQMKTYSGKRVRDDALIMIYYHDSTIAVTELGPEKLLLSCELIEIYNEKDGKILLEDLSRINRPLQIKFDEMLKLMAQCERVDKYLSSRKKGKSSSENTSSTTEAPPNLGVNLFPNGPFSVFSGIVPGTKWCGTGDIAEDYHDLGNESTMDRCCRAHDLCPIKIRAYQTKYGLSNASLYTKSHCICDDGLFSCLKKTNTTASQLMGSIYFNLVRVPCLTGGKGEGLKFRRSKEGF